MTKFQFRVVHEVVTTDWKNISAGVPQGSILLYLPYTADILANNLSMTGVLADDTAKL